MHPLLARQLRKVHWPDAPVTSRDAALLELVDAAYLQADSDLRLLEQSLEVVSEELTQRNRELEMQLRERKQMEVELRHASKLEAVGQLAAGIAHEINTPIQYIGDSVSYVQDAFADVRQLLQWYRRTTDSVIAGGRLPTSSELVQAEERADVEYALEQVPLAVQRTLEGVSHVAALVRAMKDFAHPDSGEQVDSDINAAIRSTVLVAANEMRRVAELDLDLGELPLVPCQLCEINQVVLNLLINAAHAIADGGAAQGRITVRSRKVNDFVEISVADTGTGIAPEIRDRVFEPFFTTKDVGRGTGQGLAIARTIIREKHAGTIEFESTPGHGSTFIVKLPIAGKYAVPVHAE